MPVATQDTSPAQQHSVRATIDLAFLIGAPVIVNGRIGIVSGIRISTSPIAAIYEVSTPCGRPLGWFPDFNLIEAE